ncbi:hypothetical protein FEM48_Zijuj06G0152900 [Ziziphus jujuba var. spinosa]|uniref:Uncharacterized protein n=1 Tax=Ziziphus jujuba var. spinosa TaxID=714518 RepID=A0A978VA19_ZIZJJ|nr:hypothetical protein FEM48_Zijuj06G0152900 [Ziziphus jujuba var. spinosa]
MLNVLVRLRELDSAWSLILELVGKNGEPNLVSGDAFVTLIDDMLAQAFFTHNFEQLKLMEGHVRVASKYFNRKKKIGLKLVPLILVFKILLNGRFQSRKLKQAEWLSIGMKRDNVRPALHGDEERQCETFCCNKPFPYGRLLSDHRAEKGYCKAGNLDGASKTLKMIISRVLSQLQQRLSISSSTFQNGDVSHARRTSIMWKAEAMAVMLKTCKDPREPVKYRRSSGNDVLQISS